MRTRYGSHVYRLAIFTVLYLPIPLVVAEAVFDTDNNPIVQERESQSSKTDGGCAARTNVTYHRLVKTTPKPNATKKSNGELVGPPPPLPPELVVGPGGADVVDEGADIEMVMVWNQI